MSGQKLRIGLIGCGWISEIAHMPALAQLADVEVTAIADPRDDRRAIAMDWFPGAATFRDADALIASGEAQAVVVALPPAANRAVAEAAFAAGLDVYLEKPLAARAEDGLAIAGAWTASGRVGMIGYNFRRHPGVTAAVAHLAAGRLGDLVAIEGLFTWKAEAVVGWRAQAGAGGGALSDLASHHIDLVAMLARAPVATVCARERALVHADDTADLMLSTASGVVAHLHASAASGRNANRLRLIGTGAHLEIDLTDAVPQEPVSGSPAPGRAGRLRAALPMLSPRRLMARGGEPSFGLALAAFAAACRGEGPADPGIGAGLAALQVIEAARRSSAAGGLPERPGEAA